MFSGQASAEAGVSATVELYIRKGQWRQAVQEARKLLNDFHDNDELHAALGFAASHATWYDDAVTSFSFAGAAPSYETRGLTAHADALRYTGGAAKAVELRTSRLLTPGLTENQELLAQLGLVDDLRALGDLEAAEDAAWGAVALRPRGPVTHAYMADLMLDMGDQDAAEESLWLAGFAGQEALRYWLVEARFCLDEGNIQCARRAVDQCLKIRRRHPRVTALHATVLRLEGQPEEAMELLDRSLHKLELDPNVLAARVMVLLDLGRRTEARDLSLLAAATYPDHPGVQQALAATEEG